METRRIAENVILALGAFLAVVGGLLLWEISQMRGDRSLPGSAFMTASITVPSFHQGQDPAIIYDRDISRDFRASWLVEVQEVRARRTQSTPCSGSGVNEYAKGQEIPEAVALFKWYMGKSAPCALPPGEYQLLTVWRLTTGQVIKARSNIFRIKEGL